MTRDTTGVALIGRVLARLAVAERCTAADLARDLGAARATTFAVLCDLEAVGFVSRDAKGFVTLGETAAALGYAALGLGRLAGPVHALLPILRDETDAAAELVVHQPAGECVLAQRMPANWRSAMPPDAGARLEADIEGVRVPVTLRLRLQRLPTPMERTLAQDALTAVAAALSRALRETSSNEQP